MHKTIEITKIVPEKDSIKYEIHDYTGMGLLKKEKVAAWVKYYNAEIFDFATENLPESILALPITFYMLPITWFYNIELIVPSIDKTLFENLEAIYQAYSKVYGPFKPEWKGKVTAKNIIENKIPTNHYDNIVFFSGGVDAVHAGISNPGIRNILVTVPSIEVTFNQQKEENYGNDFIKIKSRLIREFSHISESNWLLITNNFLANVFNDKKVQNDLTNVFNLTSHAFYQDGWWGMKYLGNLLSSAPFAFAMGISKLIMGSTFEPLENKPSSNMDGANPELSDSMKFSSITFAEQDGLLTRRSKKVQNITDWFSTKSSKTKIWACSADDTEQCSKCLKCIRTQLNLLCAKQNPRDWGFVKFNEKQFEKLIRNYEYHEKNLCWLWDIIDSIDNNTTYPYCNDMLHWMKAIGYQEYNRRVLKRIKSGKYLRILKIHKYPYYIKSILCKAFSKHKL
ncbi:hypothetical protein [Phocaeicola plebeius]|uniref:hypothetical protein n=1 Tax=Phocaeicola plebeius TaxID=310297 RepID=UPI0026ECD3FF|nr:hypothetical protein [Phocaeicola plebeius]MCI6051404.1 hypothetical protein [Phocaeicola plebeius]MDD6913360.1 hypothetical protein [Phocaeicola plebeius]MDY5978003.1 hypothetical protein [Phocaeicola plebeius]